MLKPMTTAFEALASRMSFSDDRADAGVDDLEVDLVAFDLAERAAERFERTLRVALQDDAQVLFSVGGCRANSRAWRAAARSVCRRAWLCRRSSLSILAWSLGFHDEEFVAGVRQAGKAEHLHRGGRAGFLDRFAVIVDERFHFAAVIAANKRVADLERADLHDDRRGRRRGRLRLALRSPFRAAWPWGMTFNSITSACSAIISSK